MAIWDDVITERDRKVYLESGMRGKRWGFGKKPAFVIIDANYNWVGDRPGESILDSIKRYPFSCGQEAWDAVKHTTDLISSFRSKKLPVAYSTSDPRRQMPAGGRWPRRSTRHNELFTSPRGHEIVDEIAPQEGDTVIYKMKPSIFFGTPMMMLCNSLEVDTLFFGGGTTSGCVRASVVDAFSYNFYVGVVQECCFDRGQVSHKINLFDMNAKYADVVTVEEVKKYLETI